MIYMSIYCIYVVYRHVYYIYIYIRHRASVHVSGVWFPSGRVSYRNPIQESLEKWQSHCSEKVNEIDFFKGVPKSRN